MAYTPEQLHVIRTIIATGQRRYGNIMAGPGRTKVLSALATAAVEQSFRNQPGGGGSSAGWRQETKESYPNVNRLDLNASVNRYYNEVDQNFGRYRGAPGALAQSVQRSAYPGRYSQHIGEAARLISHFGRGAAAGAPGGTTHVPGQSRSFDTGPVSATATVTPRASPEPGGLGGSAELIQSILQRRQQANMVPMTEPAPPSFAASRFLQGAGGFAPPPIPAMSPPTQDTGGQDIAAILSAMSQRGQGLDPAPQSATAHLPGQKGTVTGPGFDVPGGGATAGPVTHRTGVVPWGGKRVAAWIAPILTYARAHGWKGGVNSGYRSPADQARVCSQTSGPCAAPGHSMHQGTAFPRGAVDVSNAQQLASIISRSPYRGVLQWAGGKDPVHFSHPVGGRY